VKEFAVQIIESEGKMNKYNAMTTLKAANDRQKTETGEQCAFIEWCEANQREYPELEWIYHVPNGEYRHPRTAKRLKELGVKRGILDIGLDCARGGYHGLRIEFKCEGGRLSPEQKKYIAFLKAEHYSVAVVYSYEEAVKTIKEYLSGAKWETFQADLCDFVSQKHCKSGGTGI
jgi:hypothetical protein